MNVSVKPGNSLSERFPHIAAEWDYDKNEKTPSDYNAFSSKKVHWKCMKYGASWMSTIANRSNGSGCPYCTGKKPVLGRTDLQTLFPDVVKEWDYEKNELPPSAYTAHSDKKVFWHCKRYNLSWQASIKSRTSLGAGCPYCSRKRAIPGITDLQTLHPSIAAEWDYEKNEKSPSEYTSCSHAKVFWRCEKYGLSWSSQISSVTRGDSSCPYCSGKRIVPGKTDFQTIFPELAVAWDYDRNKKLPSEYTAHSNAKVFWKCKKHGSWRAMINSRARGSGCPYCAKKLPFLGETDLQTLYPDIAAEWDYKNNDRIPSDYTAHSNANVFWRCRSCGLSWQASINHRTSRNSGCPYCSGKRAFPGITDLQTLYPSIAAEWDHEKNEKTPSEYTAHSHAKVFWRCKKCKTSWRAIIKNRTEKKSGCPYCVKQRPVMGITDLATLYPEIASEWNCEKNRKHATEYSAYSMEKVYWKCRKHGSWLATICDRTIYGTGCPYCGAKKRKPKNQDERSGNESTRNTTGN